ncbi:MAG TPA: SMP-30/gluconolactonase/LRE family protein [Gaiellaceae bacterium]|nr:SMP-30/gluconolactonase/LRE family protein [Gaiellaceae bacterium]
METATLQIERLADGLGAAEGPAFLPDGRFIFVEIWRSRVSVWTPDEGVQTLVDVGGGPNSVLVCSDGSLLVTQNGGIDREWRARDQRPPSIQRVSPEGKVEVIATEIEGIPLSAPNDLAFGPDGKLYFTDPAGGFSRTTPPPPGYIFSLDPDGTGRVVAEVGQTFPNGITVEADGNVVWVESFTRAVRRYVVASGKIEDLCILEDEAAIPDGLKPAANGDLYIATVLTGGVSVVGADGTEKGLLKGFGDYVSNVQFRGSTLYVTDIGGGSGDDTEYHGSISRTTLEGVTGLELFPGRIG